MTLDEFEQLFHSRISSSPTDQRTRAGVLLSVVPRRAEWESFLTAARASWGTWKNTPERYPASLIVLYGGLAFFEYDASFWPKFAAAVGSPDKAPAGALYTRLNDTYRSSIQKLGLHLIENPERKSYVGSAVHHIGIPLSLWDGFLDICDWARVSEDWENTSVADWVEIMTRISGSRKRLRSFLIENRESASEIISEMLDARHCLISDLSLTLEGLKSICLIRPEYFDEVPETAEFLRPDSPESLIRDRPRLNWNEQRRTIGLHVPGIDHEKLPATWIVNGKDFKASATPNELQLDATAFDTGIAVKLRRKDGEEAVRLMGAKPWALFDVERSGYLVNATRESLPLRGYALISPEPLTLKREGFAEEDYPANEKFELKDDSSCYFTRLLPKDRSATLTIGTGASTSTLRFRTRKRIEARLFFGRGFRSAWYQHNDDQLTVEGLPIPCVLIPQGYFINSAATLKENFKILLDSKPGGGQWESRGEALDDFELFCWRWSERPFLAAKEGVKTNDLKQLGNLFRPLDIKGVHTLAIEAQRFAIRFSYSLAIQPDKDGLARFWKALPGKYLPMFVLTQSKDGLKSDELEFASPVIEPGSRFPYYLLKQYGDAGYLVQRGRNWTLRDSQARIIKNTDGSLLLKYCGDPAIIWALYRRMIYIVTTKCLPEIEVSESSDLLETLEAEMLTTAARVTAASHKMSSEPQSAESIHFLDYVKASDKAARKYKTTLKKKGNRTPPYLKMKWPASSERELNKFLQSRGVRIVGDLWSH